jgi:hypothetical protein
MGCEVSGSDVTPGPWRPHTSLSAEQPAGTTHLALPPQQAIGHSPAPADVIGGDFAVTMPQLSLLDRDDLGRMALGAAVLTHHSANHPLRCPVALLQDRDGPPATLRAQKFPSARSLSIAFSSSASASSFLSRAISFSS